MNLTLEVIRKRNDGYHDLASILQTVDLYDTLEFEHCDGIEFECSDASLAGDNNLVMRAAKVLREVKDVGHGAKISLKKRIPVVAGLGGGSTDAAATLRGLKRLWRVEISEAKLVEIGAELGSDIPFLISGGTAMVSRRGEVLEQLPYPGIDNLVICSPRIDDDELGRNKTARMFSMLSSAAHTTGSLTRKLAARMLDGGDCHPAFMFNAFQQMAPHVFPGWQSVYKAFALIGASDIVLTGAGPSMFAIAPSKEVATAWALLMKTRMGCDAFAVQLVPRIEIAGEK